MAFDELQVWMTQVLKEDGLKMNLKQWGYLQL
jgi:hypothetical protein